MAKQVISTGTIPNDGTGDPINAAFDKVNDNFTELYSIIGNTGYLKFTTLSDTPDHLSPHTVPFVNSVADQINLVTFGSDSDLNPADPDTVIFDYSDPNRIIMRIRPVDSAGNIGENLYSSLNMHGNYIVNLGDLSEQAVWDFNVEYETDFSIGDFVVNKRFIDQNYHVRGNPVILPDSFGRFSFVLSVTGYDNGMLVVPSHSLNDTYNGTSVYFNSTDNHPGILTPGDVYYIRYVDNTRLALYDNKSNAQTGNATIAETTRLIVGGTDPVINEHRIQFVDWNDSLSGDYLETQAVPRKHTVLRTGDTMLGELYLNDHPAPYTGESDQLSDRIAATRYYVDKAVTVGVSSNFERTFTTNTVSENDLYIATGLNRIAVTGLDQFKWHIGDDFGVPGTIEKNTVVVDMKHTNDYTIITYASGNENIESGDTISNGVGTATVLERSFSEFAQSSVHDDSHADITVTRNTAAELYNTPSVAEYKIVINPGVIDDSMIHSAAAIHQSKLSIQMGVLYDESEWNDLQNTTNIGLAAFSDQNFESNNGYVRIKDNGISLSELPVLPANHVLGNLTDDPSSPQTVSFGDLIEQGGGVSLDNMETVIFDKFDSNNFEYTAGEMSIKNNSISTLQFQQVNSRTVLGRIEPGIGNIRAISLTELSDSIDGITPAQLGDSFVYESAMVNLREHGVDNDRIQLQPPKTVMGNTWDISAPVQSIPLLATATPDSAVYRKPNGAISCSELELNEYSVVRSTPAAIQMYAPTGQLAFTSLCGPGCGFLETVTQFNGRVEATTVVETSDMNRKTNISTIQHALNLVSQMRGVRFNWKDTGVAAIGLIAQEVEPVIPEVVYTDQNGEKSISYTALVGLLVEAINNHTGLITYTVPEYYEPGTVVVIGTEYELETTNTKTDHKVAGVVKQCYEHNGVHVVELYQHGRAQCKVLGKVKHGDVLVTAAVPGYAMSSDDPDTGTIIGKSMCDKVTDVKGTVTILV